MLSDSTYQDLQLQDKNIYCNLDKPAANQPKSSHHRETSKDFKELERKLLIWRRVSAIGFLCIILIIILGVAIFVTQCKKLDSKGLEELLANTCVKNEKPCRYCSSSWIYFSGNCYFFSVGLDNWAGSRELCRSMNSQLAVIKSQEEQTFVKQTALDISWIGMSKNASGSWIWEDGTVLKEDKSFWQPYEPNNEYGVEGCVEIAPAIYNSSGWNDKDCNHYNRRICKRTAGLFST